MRWLNKVLTVNFTVSVSSPRAVWVFYATYAARSRSGGAECKGAEPRERAGPTNKMTTFVCKCVCMYNECCKGAYEDLVG
eukprot:4971081-Pyramimonas_sp.AAC.1